MADLRIERERNVLLKRVRRILERFKKLDDPFYILESKSSTINLLLRKYRDDLTFSLTKYYNGSALTKAVNDAEIRFKQSLREFLGPKRILKPTDNTRRTQRRLIRQAEAIVSEIIGRYRTKIESFKQVADSQRPRTSSAKEAIRARFTPKGRGVVFDARNVKDNWALMTQRFGKYDSVLYRNGAHYPLKEYVEMKSVTAASDAHRVATQVESARNSIYTGKISSHGAIDSCRFHEGEIVFMSQFAKSEYLKLFPSDSRAKAWKTLEEVEADRTHMFKPKCKHIVTAFPLQFMDDRRRDSVIEEAPRRRVPAKINEAKVAEEIREGKIV